MISFFVTYHYYIIEFKIRISDLLLIIASCQCWLDLSKLRPIQTKHQKKKKNAFLMIFSLSHLLRLVSALPVLSSSSTHSNRSSLFTLGFSESLFTIFSLTLRLSRWRGVLLLSWQQLRGSSLWWWCVDVLHVSGQQHCCCSP